jgi:hypothetical protein
MRLGHLQKDRRKPRGKDLGEITARPGISILFYMALPSEWANRDEPPGLTWLPLT